MKLPKHLKHLFVYSIMIFILPVILLGIYSYYTGTNNNTKRVLQNMSSSLSDTKDNMDHNLFSTNQSLTQLTQSPVIHKSLNYNLESSNFQIFREAKSHIDSSTLSIKDVDAIYLINNSSGWAIYPDRVFNMDESQKVLFDKLDASPILVYHDDYTNMLHLTELGMPYGLLFIKPIQLSFSKPNEYIVASISKKNINHWFTKSETLGNTIIVDKDMNIIASTTEKFSIDNSTVSILNDTLNNFVEDSGYFTVDIDGELNYVFYQYSDFTNWTYLSFIPKSILTEENLSITWATIVIILIIVIIMILLSYKGSLYMYSPLNNLVNSFFSESNHGENYDEFLSISKYIKSNQHKIAIQGKELQNYYVSKLLVGELFQNEVEKITELSHPQFRHFDKYIVVSLKIDSSKRTISDSKILTAKKIVQETIPDITVLSPVIINKVIVSIIGLDGDTKETHLNSINNLTNKIQHNIKEYLDFEMDIGISQTFYNLNIANQAFNESLEALRYVLLDAEKNIVFIEEVESVLNNTLLNYPILLSIQLKEAIKFDEKEKVNTILNDLITTVTSNEGTPYDYSILFIRLLSEILELYNFSENNNLNFNSQDFINELLSKHTQGEVEEWFKKKVIYPLMKHIQESKENEQKIISEEMIQLVGKYGSNSTLKLIADKLNYTPSYLSQIFQEENSMSFSQYLNMYKVNIAKEMLINTDLTVKKVAEKLSFSNSQNFIRFFKKEIGITPKRYREMHVSK